MHLFLKDILIPSANHRNKRGRFGDYNSEKYQEFKELISIYARHFTLVPQPKNKNKSNRNVSMGLTIYFDKAGRTDIDGNLKCLQDSLIGLAYDDDKQIKQYHKLKIEDYAGFNGFDLEVKEIE